MWIVKTLALIFLRLLAGLVRDGRDRRPPLWDGGDRPPVQLFL